MLRELVGLGSHLNNGSPLLQDVLVAVLNLGLRLSRRVVKESSQKWTLAGCEPKDIGPSHDETGEPNKITNA